MTGQSKRVLTYVVLLLALVACSGCEQPSSTSTSLRGDPARQGDSDASIQANVIDAGSDEEEQDFGGASPAEVVEARQRARQASIQGIATAPWAVVGTVVSQQVVDREFHIGERVVVHPFQELTVAVTQALWGEGMPAVPSEWQILSPADTAGLRVGNDHTYLFGLEFDGEVVLHYELLGVRGAVEVTPENFESTIEAAHEARR